MVVVAEVSLVCSAAGFFLAKRAKSQGGDRQGGCSERHSSTDGREERAVPFDGCSTTASSAASSSSVCHMLDDILEMSSQSRPESAAGASYSSFEAIAPSCTTSRRPSCKRFFCAQCAQGIADDEPVHMCGDAAYCSRGCRDVINDCDAQPNEDGWETDRVLCDVPLRARSQSMASLSLLCIETGTFGDIDSGVFD